MMIEIEVFYFSWSGSPLVA